MSLPCPRCQSPLASRVATPRHDAPPISAEVCARCGVWIDGAALASVSATLGVLRDRRAALPVPAEGALACPRCQVHAGRAQASGVWIDICRTCAGVWLDAGEYEALARAESMRPAVYAAPRAAGLFEAAAPLPGEIQCAACGAPAARSLTYITAKGQVCASCHVGAAKPAEAGHAETPSASDHAETVLYGVAAVCWILELLA